MKLAVLKDVGRIAGPLCDGGLPSAACIEDVAGNLFTGGRFARLSAGSATKVVNDFMVEDADEPGSPRGPPGEAVARCPRCQKRFLDQVFRRFAMTDAGKGVGV